MNILSWIYFFAGHPPVELFLGKGILKKCSKFTEHSCQNTISIKLLCYLMELILQHGCLLLIFRTSFPKSTYGELLLSGQHSLSKKKEKQRFPGAFLQGKEKQS